MKTENQDLGKNKYITKQEGSVEFLLHEIDNNAIPSKSMNVFYNKRMEINRDISILAIIAYSKIFSQESLVVVDSMAASGVGPIRLLKNTNNIEKIADIINGITDIENRSYTIPSSSNYGEFQIYSAKIPHVKVKGFKISSSTRTV